MIVKVQVLLTLTVYPLLFLMAWFYWNWRKRVTKLHQIEPLRKKSHITFTVPGLRMAALFLWGLLEAFGAGYIGAIYIFDFKPIVYVEK